MHGASICLGDSGRNNESPGSLSSVFPSSLLSIAGHMPALVVMETEVCGCRLCSDLLCKEALCIMMLSSYFWGPGCLDLLAVECGVPLPLEA